MGYFKVVLEEGRKRKRNRKTVMKWTERTVYMQGKDLTDTVLSNIKRFDHGRLLDAYPVSREEYMKAVAVKE